MTHYCNKNIRYIVCKKVCIFTIKCKNINKQYSIHDFRIVTGPTHTNLIFDVLIPSNDQIKHDLLKEQINEKLQNINPNYQTVMQIEHSFV